MKKVVCLLLALVMLLGLVACTHSTAPATEKTETTTTEETKTEEAAPAEEATEEAAPAAAGSVYWLNFKPESDETLQKVAAMYTEKTGVPVTVLTAASGTYDQVLTAEMDKDAAPTMFQAGNQGAIDAYGEWCMDLRDTDVYKEMTTDDFNLKGEDGSVLAIGYCYESFGIIVNKALLEKAGHSLDEITNFESLKAVADDIHARASELGFDAFTSSSMSGDSSWRFTGHLANLEYYYESVDDPDAWKVCPPSIKGTYMQNFKNLWDLYINNSAVAPSTLAAGGYDAQAEFGKEQAVFYQNGSWEFANLTGEEKGFKMNPEDLAMIPIYCGVEGEEQSGLCCGTENCWAVNKNAKEEDIQATLDFMKWVVTSDEGTTMLAEQFGPCPFKNAKTPENVFCADANKLIADGNYSVTWAFNWTPAVDDWRAAVVDALSKYTTGNGSWDDVKTAFVEGWATQYANEH